MTDHVLPTPVVSERMRELVAEYGNAVAHAQPEHELNCWHALLREIAALEAKTAWQPIETAPKGYKDADGDFVRQRIQVWVDGCVYMAEWARNPWGTFNLLTSTRDEEWGWELEGLAWFAGQSAQMQPTHWMPIPEAPNA